MTMYSCANVFGGLARRRFWAGLALLAGMLVGGTVRGAELYVTAFPDSTAATVTPEYTNITTFSQVRISATVVNPGYTFGYWVLDGCSNALPLSTIYTTNTPTMFIKVADTNPGFFATATAVCFSNSFTLTVSSSPTAGGTTLPAGTNTYLKGSTVSVSVTPATGYEFLSWSGSSYTPLFSNSVQVTMDSAKTLTANFVKLWNVSQTFRNGPSDGLPYTFTARNNVNLTVSVPSAIAERVGNRRYRCNGWTGGTGSVVPPNRSGASFTSVNLQPLLADSAWSWVWVLQCKVDVTNSASGFITIEELGAPSDNDTDDHWVDSNTFVRVTLTSNDPSKTEPDYLLVGGVRYDLSPINQVDLLITNPVSLVPVFRVSSQDDPGFIAFMRRSSLLAGSVGQRTFDDPDNDGLSNGEEYLLSNTNKSWYYNPINSDTDGDGMDDAYEMASVDPTNLTAEALAKIKPAATDNGAYRFDNGAGGNADNDFHWSTSDGYMQRGRPLTNIEEYRGPEGIPPWTSVAVNFGETYVDVNGGVHPYPFASNPINSRPTVWIRVPVTGDTGDQSRGNTDSSDRDTFDDGFEYSWDRWQHWDYTNAACLTNGVDEVLLVGVTNATAIYFTNTIPDWATARVFNPGQSDSVSDGPEYDVLYDYLTGKVSQHYFGAVREYNVWKITALSQGVAAAPHRIRMDNPPDGDAAPQRCSHPFLWDVDLDGLPDGYEVIFNYDPWTPRTPGSARVDGLMNPDDDWMARVSTNTLSLRNHEVYATNGFDPRVAWAQVYPARDQMVGPGTTRAPTTERYDNIDEMWGPDGIMTLIPVSPGSGADDATHGFNPDTDGDGIWDGWENYVGLSASLGSDAGLDLEGDKLSNLAEFQSFVTSSTNRLALLPVPDWNNKIFPTDPRDGDTDGDRLADGGEKAVFNGTSLSTTNLVIDGDSGLVVTQVFTVGTWNGAAYTSGGLNPTSSDTDGDTFPDPYEACYPGVVGLDGTLGDTFEDPDGDLVPNYLEYYSSSVYHWQYDAWLGHAITPPYDSGDFYGGAAGGTPKLWDWSQTLYNPLVNKVGRFGYSGATPNLVDSDTDGMDDYYEIYHGLNPAYGVLDLVVSKYLNLPIPITSPLSGPVVADPRDLPYVNGSPFMDSDGDGLPNSEEGVNLLNPERSPQYHTDPSPFWITDQEYGNSWVNLYYTPGSFWPWSGILPPPIYAYDFECNEGFDTDNDGYSDREELVVKQTDPLSPERPVKRRALYLPPGQPAYARTFPGYAYLDDSLRSFTVEAWIRPINPTSGVNQVVVERPISVPFGNPMYEAGVRVNFRLGVDPAGSPYVAYHGEGMEAIFYVAKAAAASRVSAANWTHLCGTYQVPAATNPDQRGVLTLYVNGQMAAQTNPDELPAHARFGNGDLVFQYGAPIVIGASDANPDGDMNVFSMPPSPAPFDFFKGWVDEVRVWDGARSQGQVVNSMMRRMKQADVLASFATTAPLLYLYSFDALPDPDHMPTAPAGLGFDVTGNAIFPSDWPYVYFWGTEPSRSMVYAGLGGGDPRYLPWIENAVAHVPLVPPVDIGDPAVIQNVMNGTNIVGQTLPFRNTTNPYGYRHITYPALFPEITEGFILYNDLLPLAWAAADEDITMWDGGGVPAIDPFDADGDGMPDDWEETHGLNPLDPNGDNGPDADLDGDGLSNYYEYLCGTDPKAIISSDGNIPDGELDSDGDRLNNLQELQHGTMPNMKDTDDDGLTDWEELNGTVDITWVRPATSQAPKTRSDPLNPLSPAVQRAVYLDGVSRLIVPPSDKLMSKNWTVEMWVNPATNGTGGVLASRYVGGLSASEYGITYEVGLTTNSVAGGMVRPYVRFLMTTNGVPVETRLDGLGSTEMTNGLHAVTFPKGVWTHVAGTFDSVSNIMSLYVNGELASYRTDASSLPPLLYGYGTGHRNDEVTIGASRSSGPVADGFKGYLDNVRIWSITRTAAEIDDRYNAPEGVPSARGTLTLKSGTIGITGGVSQEIAQQAGGTPLRMLVKFDSESSASELASLAAAGVQVLNYVAPGVRAIKVTPEQLTALGDKVAWAGLLKSGNKISSLVSGSSAVGDRKVLVTFFKDVVEADALQAVVAVGGTVYNNRFIAGSDLVATVNEQELVALAARNEVAWVAPAAEFLTSGRPIHRLSAHVVGGVEVAPFAVVGDGWDGPGKGSADLTYHFINYNSNLDPAVAKKAVVDPMFKWAQYASLTFTETTQAGRPYSMDIIWEQIDGPSGILGFGYFPNDINPESVAGDFHLDSEETWTIGPQPGGIDLEYVALHEQGHCLGIGHSDDPTAIMYPYYDGSRDATLAPDDIAAIQSIYGKQVAMGTLAEFRFDDGGITAQDFTVQQDWKNGWASAATLAGAIFVTNTTPPLNKDSDSDGLPDWWEMVYGLDPYDGTGDNGGTGDPDWDGLSNVAEYLSGTNPNLQDTDGDGFSDYDSRRGPGDRTWGELYDDGDGIADLWELNYPGPASTTGKRGLDPAYYDANLDPDEDGWSNYAEYMSGTDPLIPTNYPMPQVGLHLRYHGRLGASLTEAVGQVANRDVVLSFYHTASMDGYPDATLNMRVEDIVTNVFTTGHIHEGNNYVFGYLDIDGDQEWEPATEPAGIGQFLPINLGWGAINNVELGLTDEKPGYPRIAWSGDPAADRYIVLSSSPGMTNSIKAPRTYLHEGDYLFSGRFGFEPSFPSFEVYKNDLNNFLAVVMPAEVPTVSLAASSVVTPHGFTYQYARNELEFAVDANATAYRLQIAVNTNTPIVTTQNIVPYRDINGVTKVALPVYAGDNYVPVGGNYASSVWSNGPYWVRVQAFTPATSPTYSPWRNINFALKAPAQGGKSMIGGDVYYFGKVGHGYGAGQSNKLTVIVQAFESAGFSGVADGQVQITYTCNTNSIGSSIAANTNNVGMPKKGDYSLMGLGNKVYYVRAFIDVNGNRTLDSWEPMGFARMNDGTDNSYRALPIDLTGQAGVAQDSVRVVIRDRDTDDDQLPDGWEWMYYGTMSKGAYDVGVQNMTYWGPTNMTLIRCYEVDPLDVDPTAAGGDTDRDGVTDFDEICYSDRIAGTLPDVSHYEPYDPLTNLKGTDLNPMQWDTDGDGLSDGYELANGLNPLNPSGDADGDGVCDADEVLTMMTSPRLASDVLRLRQVAVVTPGMGLFSLTWEGKAGVAYQVQYSDNLAVWQDVTDAAASCSGAGSHVYAEQSPAVATRYFRVVVK